MNRLSRFLPSLPRRWRPLLAGLLLLLPALGVQAGTAAARQPLQLVVSFSILADLSRELGGPQVTVTSLLGANADAHAFQPRPSDARRISNADLIIVNGLGFDDWMARLARAGGYRGSIVTASAGIAPLRDEHAAGHDDDKHTNHHHEHGEHDPHAWLDVRHAMHYARNISAALRALDPAHASDYAQRLTALEARLQALDEEIRSQLARLPANRRQAVSSHEAFAYFSRAYGIEFLAPAGLSSHAEASAAGVARLILQLRRERIPAVFLESTVDPRLIERIASESGARIGGTLYADALSAADGPAASYISMMRHNLHTLLEALGEDGDQGSVRP